jgi:hypothetical protein
MYLWNACYAEGRYGALRMRVSRLKHVAGGSFVMKLIHALFGTESVKITTMYVTFNHSEFVVAVDSCYHHPVVIHEHTYFLAPIPLCSGAGGPTSLR